MKAICEAEFTCPICGRRNINIAQDWFKDSKWYYRAICNDCRSHWDTYMNLKLYDVRLFNKKIRIEIKKMIHIVHYAVQRI